MTSYKLLTEIAPKRDAENGKPSASPVFKSTTFKDEDVSIAGVSTLFEMFDASVKKFSGNKCLGWRPIVDGKAGDYKWWTYGETGEKVANLASGVATTGIVAGSKVGVLGPNCPEWMLAMQACNRMSLTCVPLYDTLGENAIEYIINHSESQIVFVASAKLAKFIAALPEVKSTIKTVVYWGNVDEAQIAEVKNIGVEIFSLDELMTKGQETPAEPVPPKEDDLCTIMYTSGTTGDPKGVMLTHKAVISMVASTKIFLNKYNNMGEDDIFLSYLPLAHIFDRSAEELHLAMGSAIAYWQGNIQTLVEDISAAKPTLFVGVPRVFDRIYAGVMAQVAGSGTIKKFLFQWAYRRKLSFLNDKYEQSKASPIFDTLVFSKIKQKLGGHVKVVVSGGAPIARHTEEFLRVCFCCEVAQGYGLTETCAGSFLSIPGVMEHIGTCGIPTPVTELRLESVPDMNYDALAKEPKGEILVKADSNFSGYYKNEEGTNEVLEKDGWFHTGDIGTIVGDGILQIIDRKKNIFKLSQGEYVAVEKVEEIYKKCNIVDQIWVYGNSFKSYLVGVVVPQAPFVEKWAKENKVEGEVAELVKNPDLIKVVLEKLNEVGKAGNLKGFELIKKLHLDSNPFSVEKDTLTPTFKLKRPQLQKFYQATLDKLYED
ncbi:hypothetical protein BSKO_02229 [Bryopsis sp. KO-2023]|nr:hypothetical protein BSKO_02229 [Bryopsis sp. KO-2023]